MNYIHFRLKLQEGFIEGESYLNDGEGLYKIVFELTSVNKTKKNFTLRHTYGGIWRSCDEISGMKLLFSLSNE